MPDYVDGVLFVLSVLAMLAALENMASPTSPLAAREGRQKTVALAARFENAREAPEERRPLCSRRRPPFAAARRAK
eukprot:5579158-Pyramimonas_sp.AAC.1